MKTVTLTMFVLCISQAATAAEQTAAARQYQALIDEYEDEGGARIFATRFLKLAEQHVQDPVATDALLWVVKNVRGRPDTTRALEMLGKHHVESDKLGPASKDIATSRSIAAEGLLRAASEKSPHRETRAQATFYLAALLDLEASLAEQLSAQPELAARVVQYYGKEYGGHITQLKAAKLAENREGVYEQIKDSFSDVKIQDTTMGKIAERMLFQIRHLSVGKLAPDIEGEDILGKKFRLSDYRGKVVMLSFWGHW